MTYSIVARCTATGQLGVAVASHAFGVGNVVPWARAGIGAGATQSVHTALYGAELPHLLAGGAEPAVALERLLAADDGAALRQIGVVDARGRAAGHTGGGCVPYAGGCTGPDVAAQGNMLATDGTWNAMAETFAATHGDLAGRMMAALHAAEERGGDIRGRQAAALLVIDPEPEGGTLLDVRVDDHRDPLRELDRLIALQRADRRMRAAVQGCLAGNADVDELVDELREAQRTFGGGNLEPTFWACVALARAGRPDAARLAGIAREQPAWKDLYRRLADGGLVPEQEAS